MAAITVPRWKLPSDGRELHRAWRADRAPTIPTRTGEPRGQTAFGGAAADGRGARPKQTVQIGLVLEFSARIPTIVFDRKPGQDNMSKMMTKSELIQKITDQHSDLTKKDVKAVMETLATVGYKELKKTGAFLLPGFAKFVVIKKPATKERAGINPFTKEPTVFKARPARKIIKARPVKAAKDAV
jgi:DNA-binding protein HU-beta